MYPFLLFHLFFLVLQAQIVFLARLEGHGWVLGPGEALKLLAEIDELTVMRRARRPVYASALAVGLQRLRGNAFPRRSF